MLLKFRNSANFVGQPSSSTTLSIRWLPSPFLLLFTPSSMAMLMPVGFGFPCWLFRRFGNDLYCHPHHSLDVKKMGQEKSLYDFSVHFFSGLYRIVFLVHPREAVDVHYWLTFLLLWDWKFIHHYDVDDR